VSLTEKHFKHALDEANKFGGNDYDSNKKFVKIIKEKVISGEVDKKLLLDNGTSIRLLDSYNRLFTSMPRRIKDFQKLCLEQLSTQKYNSAALNQREEIKKLYDLNYSEFGVFIPQKMFLTEAYLLLHPECCSCCTDVPKIKQAIPDFVPKFLESIKERNITLLQRKEVYEMLSKYNLSELIKIKESEFCLEENYSNNIIKTGYSKIMQFFKKK
jgi:hypothetical protein